MTRQQRLTFGENAELYEQARPSYSDDVIDAVLALTGLPCRILDAGCGTGKATLMLAERGATGVGVEPDPAMAAIATRKLAPYPGWQVEVSDFEAWLPEGELGTFDLVTCAQAWHWIDRELGGRNAKRLLRPGGWLAIWGDDPIVEDSPMSSQIGAAYELYGPPPDTTPALFDLVPSGPAFGEPLEREFSGTRSYTTAEWIALQRTASSHQMLPPRQLEQLLSAVGNAIDAHGGTLQHHFVTRLWAARRR